MYLQVVLVPSDEKVLGKHLHLWSSLTTYKNRYSKSKEEVGSGKRAPVQASFLFGCVGEVISCLSGCIIEIGANAVMVDEGGAEQQRLTLGWRVVTQEYFLRRYQICYYL